VAVAGRSTTKRRAANVHEYDIADLLGHSTAPGDMRNTKATRGYAHGIPKRLSDAVNSMEEESRLFGKVRQLRTTKRKVHE
jgi:hypothetical protein